MNYHPRFAEDRDFQSARSAFIRAKKLSAQYGARLRKIARHVGDIVQGFEGNIIGQSALVQTLLRRYADTITPWAEVTAERMVSEVALSDKNAWRKVSAQMGRAIHREIESAPTGAVMRALKAENITLIRSLPLEAAERVHRLTTKGLASGMRSSEIAAEILRTEDVTISRANLIARTETSRSGALLTQARAQHIGSTGYLWRTSKDSDVRPSHKKMEAVFVPWNQPPTLDGMIGHAGCLPNCRCYAEVVIPD